MIMKYVALIRGINVGGKSVVKMADLKKVFEKLGFTNVVTYINSGNVIFETKESDSKNLSKVIEQNLTKYFKFDLRIVLVSEKELNSVIKSVPLEWKKRNDLRCYVAFVRKPITPKEVLEVIEPKEEVDSVKLGEGVIYLTTKLEGITKSGFTKLIKTKIYKDITIRNYNTVQKLQGLIN